MMTRGSHLQSNNSRSKCIPRRYILSAGDIIYFHPRSVHGGDSFKDSNIRIHYYGFQNVDNIGFKVDKTFPLTRKEHRRYSWTQSELRNKEAQLSGAQQKRCDKNDKKKRRRDLLERNKVNGKLKSSNLNARIRNKRK